MLSSKGMDPISFVFTLEAASLSTDLKRLFLLMLRTARCVSASTLKLAKLYQ